MSTSSTNTQHVARTIDISDSNGGSRITAKKEQDMNTSTSTNKIVSVELTHDLIACQVV
jgi:hypothetical protein